MKIDKKIKRIEKDIERLDRAVAQLMFIENGVIPVKIIEDCAKIAEDFFEDDKIEGIQIAKEIRDTMNVTPISKKSD